MLVFGILVISGLGEPFGVSGVVAVGLVVVAMSGILSVVHGESYLERLLKLIKWLG